MPSGSHGGGGGHSSSHSSFHSGSSRPARIYHPITYYRHGVAYQIGGSRIARIMNILPFMGFLLVFGLIMLFVMVPSAKDSITEFESDYNRYQEMIDYAKENPEYKTYALWADWFEGSVEYDDDNYSGCYGYKYFILELNNGSSAADYTDSDGNKYYYVTDVDDDYMYAGKFYGYTYLIYSYDEVIDLKDEYRNSSKPIEIAIDSVNTDIRSDTDSIPMDYENVKLENNYEYTVLKSNLTFETIIMIVMLSISGILLVVLIYNLVPRKKDAETIENKNINRQFKEQNDSKPSYDRNAIFDESDKFSKTCPFCGKEVNSDNDRCPFCGSKFL